MGKEVGKKKDAWCQSKYEWTSVKLGYFCLEMFSLFRTSLPQPGITADYACGLKKRRVRLGLAPRWSGEVHAGS